MRLFMRVVIVFALGVTLIVPGLIASRGAFALSCGPCPATTTDDLNLRVGPSLDDEVLLVIPAFALLEYDSSAGNPNGFVSVVYDGVEGWAHEDYLWFWPGFGTTTSALNLRAEADLDAEVIVVMPEGADVQILEGPVNGFFAVRYNETPGWASADYISVDDQGTDNPPDTGEFAPGDEVVVNTDFLNFRLEPTLAGEVIDVLPTGTQGTVLNGQVNADGYVWFELELDNGTTGWVAGSYLSLVAEGGGFAIGDDVVVNTADGLNSRSGPGLAFDVLSTWPEEQTGTITSGPVYSDDYMWWEVSPTDNGDLSPGWLAGEFLAGA